MVFTKKHKRNKRKLIKLPNRLPFQRFPPFFPSYSALNKRNETEYPHETEQKIKPCKQSYRVLFSSDRRDSNPRAQPWQGRVLPTAPLSHLFPVASYSPRQKLYYYIGIHLSNVFLYFFIKTFTYPPSSYISLQEHH